MKEADIVECESREWEKFYLHHLTKSKKPTCIWIR